MASTRQQPEQRDGVLRRGFALGLGLVMAAAFVLPVPVASAQDGGIALADGSWRGTMGAVGSIIGSTPEGDVFGFVSLNGSHRFAVSSASINGSWDWSGTVDMRATTQAGEVPIALQTVGGGPMSGGSAQLQLTGSETTTGSTTFMGTTTPIGPNTHAIDPIDVRFTDVGCHVVFGDWVTSLSQQLGEQGFDDTLSGWFVATAQGETTPGEELAEELESRYRELEEQVFGIIATGDGLTTPRLFEVFRLLEEAVQLEEDAANLESTCAYEVADGPFATPLTSVIVSILPQLVESLSATQLFNAAQMLVAVGALGGGASEVLAVQLESAIADRAQQWHDVFVTTEGVGETGRSCSSADPCVLSQHDVLQLHLAASVLGFELTAGGVPVDMGILVTGR